MTEPFVYNRLAAAEQDYELAQGEHAAVMESFDATDEQAIGRYHATQARLKLARERWLEAKL